MAVAPAKSRVRPTCARTAAAWSRWSRMDLTRKLGEARAALSRLSDISPTFRIAPGATPANYTERTNRWLKLRNFYLGHTKRLINVEAGPKGGRFQARRAPSFGTGEIPTSGPALIEHLLASLLRGRIDGVLDLAVRLPRGASTSS